MRDSNSSKISECPDPAGLPGSAARAALPRAFAHKRKVLERREMPKAERTFAPRAPGGKIILCLGPEVDPSVLGVYRVRGKKTCKNLIF